MFSGQSHHVVPAVDLCDLVDLWLVGGANYLFHGLCNYFVLVAERDFMRHGPLTKRLVSHARPGDAVEGFAADRNLAQLREPAQRIANNIEAVINAKGS